MSLFAFVGLAEAIPILVFVALVAGVFAILTAISNRNSKAASRLDRISRPASLVELEESKATKKKERFGGMVEAAKAMSAPLMPQTELEQSALRIELANAGFRSESAPSVYLGIRFVFLLTALIVSSSIFIPLYGLTWSALQPIVIIVGIGYYLPQLALWYLRTSRQQEIFLSLPDALDLLVVCVESGLGLDAAMRKVCEEMSHYKALVEEFTLANFQLQMGRPRREVLHDLGVRTGVDDVKALAAILIQADRFGASIANALRVQSDSMRTRRKQIAEEKAAKTAVQLIFPLVLFIFPGIFVVLVGPAAIGIMKVMLKK
ncbi:MAG: type II secretion system F family protein [Gemmataceae bacterium]